MKTNVDLEYVPSFTYELEEQAPSRIGEELDDVDEAVDGPPRADSESFLENATADDVSQSDLGYFMNLASRFELLTAEQEWELGMLLLRSRRRLLRALRLERRASNGQRISHYVAHPTRPVTASTRRRLARVEELARRIVDSEDETGARRAPLAEIVWEMDVARQKLVEHNLRLVVWVAKKFRGRGFDFIDLIQEGSLGLMRAIDRYDPLVGARFSTFATHWVKQGIRRALAERARTIRIPVNRIPEARELAVVRARLAAKLGRSARPEEIAAAMKLPTHKVEELLPAIAPIDSIDAPRSASERSLLDTLEDRDRPTPLDEAMGEETRRAIATVLRELPRRERVILSMRHGIGYPRECTLEEIGEALGLSRERIRQVEKTAAAAVRDWIRENHSRLAEPV